MNTEQMRFAYEAVLRTDFMTFVDRSFSELNPQTRFSRMPHIEIMAAYLEKCRRGEIKRLIVNLPPRSLKSHAACVCFSAWLLGHDPAKQIICASYGQDLADKHARDSRNLMLSPFYRRIFPGTRLSVQKQAVNDFVTTATGFRMSTSVGGVLTGRGADIIIIDDPMKPDEALSESRRTGVNEWFDNSLLSRLNSKENGVILIVMQRLHQDDLVGHVLEQGDWTVLSFPAIAEEDERHVIHTPLGTCEFLRKAGQVLDPERESLATLEKMRQTVGGYTFSSQYQQNPIPVGGAMIKMAWFKYYESTELPEFSLIIQSWDTANKSGELNDFSVCTTWGVRDGRYYLLDVFRARLEYPDLRRAVQEQYRLYNPSTILIEEKASGTQLLQDLLSLGLLRVKAYNPPAGSDKIMRLVAQSAVFENGGVFLPHTGPWVGEYVRELTGFPGTKFDDQVDSTTQALDYLREKGDIAALWARFGKAIQQGALERLCPTRFY